MKTPRMPTTPWNKGKLVGQKLPLKLSEIWSIRIRLQLFQRNRELALFNLAIDSKLRACDLVKIRIQDLCHGDHVANRAEVLQGHEGAVDIHQQSRPQQREGEVVGQHLRIGI